MGSSQSNVIEKETYMYILSLHDKINQNTLDVIGIYDKLNLVVEAEKCYKNVPTYNTKISKIKKNYTYGIPGGIFRKNVQFTEF